MANRWKFLVLVIWLAIIFGGLGIYWKDSLGKVFDFNLVRKPSMLSCSFIGPTSLKINQVGTYTSISKGNISNYIWTAPWSPDEQSPISGIRSSFQWSGPTPGLYTISLTIFDATDSLSCEAEVLVS